MKDSVFIKNFPPYIGDNGNWFEFDINKGLYIDTGIQAKGAKGDKGDKGDNGTTPIKGIDYFTNEDITAFKNEVINTIPPVPTKTSELINDSNFISEETDPTVPEWAKQSEKPTYTADEIGAISKGADISELNNDVGYLTEHQSLEDYALKTEIPTKVSELENDSKYLTTHQDISGKVDKVQGKGLSTNDYTNEDKAKVDAIPTDPKYTDTVYDDSVINNKITELQNKNTFDTLNVSNTLQIGDVPITESVANDLLGSTRKFECVLDITVEEDVKKINIPTFADGTPLKTQNIIYEAYLLKSDKKGNIGLALNYNKKLVAHCVTPGARTDADMHAMAYVINMNGLYFHGGCNTVKNATWDLDSSKIRAKIETTADAPYFEDIYFSQLNGGTIKAGSTLKVYAIRMEE